MTDALSSKNRRLGKNLSRIVLHKENLKKKKCAKYALANGNVKTEVCLLRI